jgi:hypothetical protein
MLLSVCVTWTVVHAVNIVQSQEIPYNAWWRSFRQTYGTKESENLPHLLGVLWNVTAANTSEGRAIIQADSRRLLTAAARIRDQVKSCGVCGGASGTGAGFLRILLFPLPILIPLTAPHSSSLIRGWHNRPNSGRRAKWTQSHPIPRN